MCIGNRVNQVISRHASFFIATPKSKSIKNMTCLLFNRIEQSSCTLEVTYRKTPSISRTKFENLNLSCILLQLSSLNPLKPGVKLRMKM